ncbi:MAG: hypothetical protein IPH13_01660 [Planctomycetes bacterium]|nr:hypothetical protein [Planctomycetota bacterium]MCC7171092.1 hypothetical protein [Planctomycetota bacterium]
MTAAKSGAPFIIGVTGNMNIAGYTDAVGTPDTMHPEVRSLYDRIWAILDWARSKDEEHGLDPATGTRERIDEKAGQTHHGPVVPWLPLGLEHTPIVVLSSLAPGVDTLVAEAALDYARSSGADVTVRAVLPFPLEDYVKSSTFHVDKKPSGARIDRLRRLVWSIEQQPSFVRDRDLAVVALHPRVYGVPTDDLKAESADGPRRHLRYRAAGELIATTCHLLIAAYDPADDERDVDVHDLYVAGAAAIAKIKQQGLSFELLRTSNSFAWADNGPTLRIPTRRNEASTRVTASGSSSIDLLDPFDLCPWMEVDLPKWRKVLLEIGIPWPMSKQARKSLKRANASLADVRRAGDRTSRSVLERVEAFNRESRNTSLDPSRLNEKLFGVRGSNDRNLASEAVSSIVVVLEPMIRARAWATGAVNKLAIRRRRLMTRLLLLVLIGTTALGSYEHWPRSDADGAPSAPVGRASVVAEPAWWADDALHWTQFGLLAGTLVALAAIGILFFRYERAGCERDRYDWRVLSEGIRVQLNWCLAGVGASVSTDTMQRQRGELSWIRYVIKALAGPVEMWEDRFSRLTPEERVSVLRAVRGHWVDGQRDYFERAADAARAARHFCHNLGWSLLAAGLLNVIGKCISAASPHLGHSVHDDYAEISVVVWGLGASILAVRAVVVARRDRQARDTAEHDSVGIGFFHWLLWRPVQWSWSLIFGVVPYWVAHAIGDLPDTYPNAHSRWLILTSVVLVIGGLVIAWSERSFYSEDARRYRGMEQLFYSADRRLERLIDEYEKSADDRYLAEINDILFQLGREALDENAEWLILHRTRPLEPFLAA